MIKYLAIFLIAFSSVFGGLAVSKPERVDVDLCPYCVDFMDQAVGQLVKIMEGGVVGSCGAVCSKLGEQYLEIACDLLCDYVGITEFAKILTSEDPDPIYICQLMDFCGHTEGGKVNITSTSVQPKDGRQGATFTLTMEYDVISATSVGGIDVNVIPPQGFPVGGGSFTEGQQPGHYRFQATIDAKPSEQEPWSPGLYKVQFAVCAGDCSTKHPYGGVYAVATNTFTISQ